MQKLESCQMALRYPTRTDFVSTLTRVWSGRALEKNGFLALRPKGRASHGRTTECSMTFRRLSIFSGFWNFREKLFVTLCDLRVSGRGEFVKYNTASKSVELIV